MDVLAHHLVVAGIAHDVDAAEISYRRKHRMRTIQQRHLTLVVWLLTWGNQHVQTSLLSRELSLEVIDVHVFRLLNHPQVECFTLHNKIVGIANLLLDLCNFLTWKTWHDAIHQRGAYIIIFREPLLESSIVSAEVVLP